MFYPLKFHPIFKERIWGGRRLETLYGKALPAKVPVGEAWEISDRPGDESVIANGPLAGKTLHWLMENHRQELLSGAKIAGSGRFPLLIKILDAQEKLSLQVHPPANKAAALGGEPKTEMWFVADATPEADLFVGLKKGVTQAEFQKKTADGTVANCFHRIVVKKGDVMFLPSGRVHALGAGSVIFEIQQNSDTTYRVFDWNRVDASGKPRDLHVAQSMESIDFNDFEPLLVQGEKGQRGGAQVKLLVQDPLFTVSWGELEAGKVFPAASGIMQIFGTLTGSLIVEGGGETVVLKAGEFCLVPAAVQGRKVRSETGASFLEILAG